MIAGSFSFTCLIANDRSKICFRMIAKDQGNHKTSLFPAYVTFYINLNIDGVIFESSQTMVRLLSLQPAYRCPIFFERKDEATVLRRC